jgi:large subunit ribosomal protein L30
MSAATNSKKEASASEASKIPTLKITLRRSVIGVPDKHVRVIRALGLRKTNSTVQHSATPIINGMVHKVLHLLTVETLEA